mmetsp:Transcript_3633/g.11955  ORF Transcript_3633/g.11955 Transcript_3633/m.11955 type:complete len:158 (+) Transcript_3633:470-943(+)
MAESKCRSCCWKRSWGIARSATSKRTPFSFLRRCSPPSHGLTSDTVKWCLENGCDPNPRIINESRSTPLHRAACSRVYDFHRKEGAAAEAIVRLLLSYGADVNARDDGPCSETPLLCIAKICDMRRGVLAATRLLLEGGADPNLAATTMGTRPSELR